MDITDQTSNIYEDSSKIALVLTFLMGLIIVGIVLVAFEVGKTFSVIQTYERKVIRP